MTQKVVKIQRKMFQVKLETRRANIKLYLRPYCYKIWLILAPLTSCHKQNKRNTIRNTTFCETV